LKRHFEAQGIPLLGLQEGAQMFVDELLHGAGDQVELVMGSLPPAQKRELRVRINQQSHPFLEDHRIQNMPVLPAVEAVELFLRAARAQGSRLKELVCENLKVLKGVLLDGFYDAGNLLIVRPRAEGVYELVGADGSRHYEATVNSEEHDSTASRVVARFLGTLREAPWSKAEIYGKLLFHGPNFQVIRNLVGISDKGITGTVTGTAERKWDDGNRESDAAMLDGGLQLARLWGYHALGKPTLPTKIGCVRIHRPEDGTRPVQCRVAGEVSGKNKILCDIEFTSELGELLATMTGVEMHATAGA
jgi:Polyketide synthase dehydratase